MPIVPSRRGEIRALLERLAHGRAAEQEAAVARLRLLGARVLEALAGWLPGAPAGARALALRVLEGLPEARALGLALGLCHDAAPEVAARAVETVATLPLPGVAAGLAGLLRHGASSGSPVERAVGEALAQLAAAGNLEALDALLDLLLDEGRPEELRRVALPVVAALPRRERRPVLERLARSSAPGLAAEARRLLGSATLPDPAAAVERLLVADADEVEGALEALCGLGVTAAEAVVARLLRGPLQPGQAARLGRALGRLGPGALEALRTPLELATSNEALAAAAEALAAWRLPATVPLLHTALSRLAGEPDPGRRAESAAARAALHHALASLDSRAGLYDLRELLAARPVRGLGQLLPAAAAVGDASVARLLLRLAADQPALAAACREPLAAIVRREKLRRASRALRDLTPGERRALDQLWPQRASRR